MLEDFILSAEVAGVDKITDAINTYLKVMESGVVRKVVDPEDVELFDEFINKTKTGFIIYSDKDVDGIASATIMTRLLDRKNIKYRLIIAKEYEVDEHEILKARADNFEAVVLLDIGSSSLNKLEKLALEGLKVLVIDHHSVEHNRAVYNDMGVGIINPYLRSDSFKQVSTSGVLYELIKNTEGGVLSYDKILAMLSTLADVQPSIGVNQEIIKEGLYHLNLLGEDEFVVRISGGTKITKSDVLMHIIPKLNLISKNNNGYFVHYLLKKRKAEQQNIFKFLELYTDYKNKTNNVKQSMTVYDVGEFIVAVDESGEEVRTSGIANRLMNKFGKPTIFLKKVNEVYIGSARWTNILKILKSIEHLFEKLGGHQNAAGFQIKQENLEELKRELMLIKIDKHERQEYDIELSLVNLERFYNELKLFYKENQVRAIETIRFMSKDTTPIYRIPMKNYNKLMFPMNVVHYEDMKMQKQSYNILYKLHYHNIPSEGLYVYVESVR